VCLTHEYVQVGEVRRFSASTGAHDGVRTADADVTGDAGESAGSRKASTASRIACGEGWSGPWSDEA
jgi:hypothetical protein